MGGSSSSPVGGSNCKYGFHLDFGFVYSCMSASRSGTQPLSLQMSAASTKTKDKEAWNIFQKLLHTVKPLLSDRSREMSKVVF